MKVDDTASSVLGKNIELSITDAERLYNTGNFQDFSYNRVATRVGQEMLLQTAKIPVALVGTVGQIPYAISTAGKDFEKWVAANEEHTMGYGQGLSNISQAIKETRIPQEESDKQREEALRKEMQQAGFFKTGLPKRVEPESGVIFDGEVGVKIMDKAKALGDVLMSASNRTLEEMNREAEKVMVKLSPEEQESLTYKFSQVGVNYATMLGLSTLSPAAGLNYMTALTLAGETEEGFETYKAQNKGSFEGYSEQAGQDFWSNIINTGVQRRIENLIGVPAQVRFFRNAKEFGKAMLVGGGGELLEEELQNLTDDIIDDFNGRLEGQVDKNGNPLTWWSKWVSQITDINAVAIGAFGAMGGAAFAAHNRAAVKSEIRSFVEQRVEPNKVEQVVDAVYNSADLTIKNVLAKEIEYTSSLQSKRGDVYESLHKAFSEAVRDARERGAFPELETEEDVADYVTTLTNTEADKLLVEAKARGTTVAEMVDARLIEFKNGQLILPMTKGVTSEERTLYSFAGINAQTADKESQRLAENMELNDYTPEEIWKETGWKKGKDGKWRFELSDKDAIIDLSNLATDTGTTLEKILEHEKLFAAYPQLRNLYIMVSSEMKGSDAGARYIRGRYDEELGITTGKRIEINPDIIYRRDVDLKSTLLHEVQHAIQEIEGFATGASPEFFRTNKETLVKFFQEEDNKKYEQAVIDYLYEEVSVDQANKISEADDKVIAAAEKFAKADDGDVEAEEIYDDAVNELNNALQEAGKTTEWFAELKTKARYKAGISKAGKSVRAELYSPVSLYKSVYGEREAFATMDRMEMSEEERRANYPEYEEGSLVITQTGEVMELAIENEQLDAENPVYGGETININGVEKTVYNSNGDRIAKSKEALENFYRWFGNSKVVDEQGRPLVVYHGTGKGFDTFLKEKRGELTRAKSAKEGFWFTTGKETAQSYAEYAAENSELNKLIRKQQIMDKQVLIDWKEYDKLTEEIERLQFAEKQEYPVIMPVYLKAENVNTLNAKNKKFMDIQDKINSFLEKSKNKDGVIIYNLIDAVDPDKVPEAVTHIMVKEPNQIKSTSNRGTYSLGEDNIYKQGEKGSIKFEGDKALITLTERADSTTLPHELAHYYLQNTFLYTKSGLASQEYMDNFNQIAKYLDISPEQETIKEWQQEKWARAYELYQMGKTPERMEKPLTQYNLWLRKAYEGLQEPMYQDENGKMVVPEFDYDTMKMFASLAGETLTEPQFKENQERVRGLAKSTNEMAKAKGIETELPTYEKRSATEMGKKADEFIQRDKQLAIDIVKGLKPEQEGIFRQDLYAALRELALNEGDSDLLNELSRSMTVEEATELGQRIQALARGRIDPVKQMVELRDERMKKNKVDKKKVKEETEKATKEIKKEIAEAATPKEWADFIQSLEC